MYLVRFDDIAPDMHWCNFLRVKETLEKYSIKSVLGVVPENRDPKLSVEAGVSEQEFFSRIRSYKSYGDTIAQHGTYHLYDIKDSGILKINNKSEFSGHSYQVQLEKLQTGKEILQRNDVWQPYFMAPSHSFDVNTLKALKALGFKAVTDGYGFYPYMLEGIVLVPQLVSKPMPALKFGIQTICLHTNNMTDNQINDLIGFIEHNHSKFLDFENVAANIKKYNFPILSKFLYALSKIMLITMRKVRG